MRLWLFRLARCVLPIQPPRTVRMPVHAADGLVKTFNALLEIAQTEAHSRRSAWEPFRLVALAGDVAELYAPLAEDKHLALELDLGHEAVIHGSRHLIAQALGNLLDNAITFTPTGGRIRLAVEQHGEHIALVVEDTGPRRGPRPCYPALRTPGRCAPHTRKRSGSQSGQGGGRSSWRVPAPVGPQPGAAGGDDVPNQPRAVGIGLKGAGLHSTTALLALLLGPQMVHAQPEAEAAPLKSAPASTPQERCEAGR
jgi:hypothetical protein